MTVSIGAIEGASSLRILGLIASGPAALWILRFNRSFRTPDSDILISGIVGWGEVGGSRPCWTCVSQEKMKLAI